MHPQPWHPPASDPDAATSRATRRASLRGVSIACAAMLVVGLVGSVPAAAGERTATRTMSGVAAAAAAKIGNWHLAPSLAQLRAEVDARWPARSRASDGAIGDARHRRSRNSHNPVGTKHGPKHGTRGAVHALDITAAGIDTSVVLAAVVGDPRVWYVIFDGRIWSRTTGWASRRQPGDPHTTHIHVSLRDSTKAIARAAEKDTSKWLSARSATKASRAARLTTKATQSLQKALIRHGYRIPSGPTGWYGPETTKAVRAYQRDQGWTGSGADGIAGATTLRRLGVNASDGSATAKPAAKKKAAAKKKSAAKKKASAKKKAAAKKTAAKKTAAKKAAAKKAAMKKAAARKAAAKKAAAKARGGAYVPGTASREVYFLQEALIERGYSIPAGPTGYFGVRTVEAVKEFQRDQGWSGKQADGVPGTGTLRKLGLL